MGIPQTWPLTGRAEEIGLISDVLSGRDPYAGIATIGPAAVAQLGGVLGEPTPARRSGAIRALGRIGNGAPEGGLTSLLLVTEVDRGRLHPVPGDLPLDVASFAEPLAVGMHAYLLGAKLSGALEKSNA